MQEVAICSEFIFEVGDGGAALTVETVGRPPTSLVSFWDLWRHAVKFVMAWEQSGGVKSWNYDEKGKASLEGD